MPGETSGEVRLAAQEIDAAFSGRLKNPGSRIRSEMTLNRRFSGQAPLDDCRVNRLLFTTPETPCPISPYEVSANSLANLSLNSGS
ncbi:hypothetical protein DS67_03645 [Mesotoga sp. SC_4PWA21]|nr:hypothetical protein DS67_03645 [Mesotoga sp. SC_4PWA21]